MTIYLGSDHRGFALKEAIRQWLVNQQYQIVDLGNTKLDPQDDYPDFAAAVAKKISENSEQDKGIVFCGSGVGVDIVVNRFSGVRCAFVMNKAQVEMATRDDHVNMLAVPADFITEDELKEVVLAWLMTIYSQEERHLRRLKKIDELSR